MARSLDERLYPPLDANELRQLAEARGGIVELVTDRKFSDNADAIPLVGPRFVEMRNRLDDIELTLYDGSPRALYLGIIGATKPNAFAYATPTDDTLPFDFVGVNIGFVATMSDLFGRMLAFPDFFTEVGDPKLESSPPPLAHLSVDVMSTDWALFAPNCPVRRCFAGLLAAAAVNFFLSHEVAHLVRGHFEFMRSLAAGGILSKGHTDRVTITPIVRQALEWDADFYGLQLLLINSFWIRKTMDSRIANGASNAMAQAYREAYVNPERLVGYMQFSAYMCFRIFDVAWCPTHQNRLSHPLPAVRMYLIARTALLFSNLYAKFGVGPARFRRINKRVVQSAEEACAKLLGKQVDTSMLESVDGSIYLDEYWAELNREWGMVNASLKRYSNDKLHRNA